MNFVWEKKKLNQTMRLSTHYVTQELSTVCVFVYRRAGLYLDTALSPPLLEHYEPSSSFSVKEQTHEPTLDIFSVYLLFIQNFILEFSESMAELTAETRLHPAH